MLKLTDFGFAKEVKSTLQTPCYTPYYVGESGVSPSIQNLVILRFNYLAYLSCACVYIHILSHHMVTLFITPYFDLYTIKFIIGIIIAVVYNHWTGMVESQIQQTFMYDVYTDME